MTRACNAFTLLLVMAVSMLFSAGASAELSYAPDILQYVREDKVYLLEKIRQKVSKPSEKLLVEALLTEDGPKAASLYRKQLEQYPDPQLDPVSRSRLAAFDQALGLASSAPQPLPPQTGGTPPSTTSLPPVKPVSTPVSSGIYTLQFGSFGSRANAQSLAQKVSARSLTTIVQMNGMHKVRLQQRYATREEAAAFARTLPFESIVVPAEP